MKTIKSILPFIIFLLIYACSNKGKTSDKIANRDPHAIQSFEIYKLDTFNRTDYGKNKQGHWEIRKVVACTKTIQAIFTGEPGVHTKIINDFVSVKLEDGEYIDNKKEGLWKKYFPSGKVKDSVMYKNNVAIK